VSECFAGVCGLGGAGAVLVLGRAWYVSVMGEDQEW
jgi:hypothetical protein